MPTDTVRSPTAVSFALRAVAWSLAFFGVLRLTWIEAHILLPFSRLQGVAATRLVGTSTLPVAVTLACSGADALALCVGTVLAYPVLWRKRLAGAVGGAALILGLNILRIGTLGKAAASPEWFNALHIYVWPAVLTLAIAGYVFAWMLLADRRPAPKEPTRRFVLFTVAFLLAFTVAAPLYLESAAVLTVAAFVARAAAVLLRGVGVNAHATATVLWTPRGGFMVTQECISTPLIPVYLAAVCAFSITWRRLVVGALAAAPLFIALGIARLLVVAIPDALLASPLFLVHAFYQLLLGAVVVFLAALWRHGRRSAVPRALVGIGVGVLLVYLLGPSYTRVVTALTGVPIDDPQGAIAFLPAFQIGLYLALWVAAFVGVGWTRFAAGLAALELTQIGGLLAVRAISMHGGMFAHVRDVRGWAVAVPLAIVVGLAHRVPARR
ncbi:MAG TPA: hypothetical protein VFA59_08230 [Vicinamibacterales bacterium]|nr:hypothetical protein [Vicinamibacterales bacterium]